MNLSIHADLYSSLAMTLTLSQEVFGRLVLLGFDIAAFTPATYLRRRLRRPYEILSWGGLRA